MTTGIEAGTVAEAAPPMDRAEPPPRPRGSAAPTVPAPAVGRAPIVLALSGLGVVLVSLAYQRGRTGAAGAEPVYWAGQVVVFVPVVARMLARRLAGPTEAFLLVVGLAVNQYLLKWMYSPDQLKFPDELQHFATTTTVLRTGRLFEPSPALPVASDFPGLAEFGAAVASLTGMSVTAAGLLVAGVIRLVLVGVLFALVRRAGGSARLAGMTCLVYTTGQHYLFFDAMYLYQAAALPFVLLALWAVNAWRRPGAGAGMAVVGVVSIMVVTVTHHVSAVVLAAVLSVLAVVDLVARPGSRWWGTAAFASVAVLVVGLWLAFPAREVVDYFRPPAEQAWAALVGLLTGAGPVGRIGSGSPHWQLAVQAAGLLLLFWLLVKAARAAVRPPVDDRWWYVVLTGGLLFFAGNALWFAGAQGPELAGRIATFSYLPMSVVAAAELIRPRRRGRRSPSARRGQLVAGTAVVGLLMVGARAGGWPPWWERLPGPYRVGSFERSVDPQNLAAARWTGAWLGAGHRITADVTGWILLASLSYQSPIGGEAASVYYNPEFGLRDARLVDQLSVEYVWVDLRMSEQTPASGAYFVGDPESGRHRTPVPRANLVKFGELPGVNLVYDSGDIRIYDVRNI
jgi:hypothetical protein